MVKVIGTDGVNTAEGRCETTFAFVRPVSAEVDIKPETINLKAEAAVTRPSTFDREELTIPAAGGTVILEVTATLKDGTPFQGRHMVKLSGK